VEETVLRGTASTVYPALLKGMTKEEKREALRFIEGQKLLAEREKSLMKRGVKI
jgi:hypothetical protein